MAHSARGRPPVFPTGNDGSIPSCATRFMSDAGSSSGRTLDFESGYGRSNRSPAASSLTILKFPLRPMAGRCALNAEIVVRVHGREPELWSIGRMADRLSAGTGSIPVSSAISLREIRPAARTLASRSSYEGSSPSSPAKSEHGIAAGASGLQPDDASSTLAARSMRKSSSGEDATLPTSRARVRVPPSAPS